MHVSMCACVYCTHFELGFSVNAISRGKEWLNGKVESQRNCRCFNKKVFIRDCGKRTAAKRLRWENLFGGGSMKNHESNRGKVG